MREDILKNGSLEQVKKLIPDKKGILAFPLGKNPLHYAAQNKDGNVIRYLVEEVGLNSDRESDNKVTPLHEAAHCGNFDAICILIQHGADYHKKNPIGQDVITILKAMKKFDLVPKVNKVIEDRITQDELKKKVWIDEKETLRHRRNNSSTFNYSLNPVIDSSDKKILTGHFF